MSGTRFARSGRCRLFVCLVALMLVFGMVAIFHSSQQQLDESREQRLRCEQQQEALNTRLQSILDQKISLEQTMKSERHEQMITSQKLTQNENDQKEAKEKYDNLQQNFNNLQSEHNKLAEDYNRAKRQHTEATNALEKKLQLLHVELEKQKSTQESEDKWKEKYNALVHEKERLDAIISANDPKVAQQRISQLEHIVAEYKSNCDYKPKEYLLEGQQQINKPLNPPDTTRNISPARPGFDKPQNLKSFNEQQVIAPKPLKKVSEETHETQLKQHQPEQKQEIGNANIAVPLSAPLKHSTETKKGQAKILSRSSSTSIAPPLSLPLSSRRLLPDNVAPIPENFDQLLKNDEANHKAAAEKFNNNVDAADIDAAVEELPKNDADNDNNRYANVVNELEQKPKVGAAANEDSGAHEIKDHDFINDQNFNLPADEDNFFGGLNKPEAGLGGLAGDTNNHKAAGGNNDDDDDLLGNAGAVGIGGDIAVKNQNLLDGDSLNNEVMRDQGKEFPADGLRLEDANDEDEDEDDYSNHVARKQGGQAIRN